MNMRKIVLNGAHCRFDAEFDRTYGNIRVYGTPYEAEVYVGNRKIYSGSANLGTAVSEDKWFARGYGQHWKWRIPIARHHELYVACQRFEARANNERTRKESSGCYLRKGVGK